MLSMFGVSEPEPQGNSDGSGLSNITQDPVAPAEPLSFHWISVWPFWQTAD